uniref:Interleukin-11 receptor subunit alpha n=1 Tax=Anas zonorhyncha TaxID=75864 RepID=A0A8B9UBP5_9AVES
TLTRSHAPVLQRRLKSQISHPRATCRLGPVASGGGSSLAVPPLPSSRGAVLLLGRLEGGQRLLPAPWEHFYELRKPAGPAALPRAYGGGRQGCRQLPRRPCVWSVPLSIHNAGLRAGPAGSRGERGSAEPGQAASGQGAREPRGEQQRGGGEGGDPPAPRVLSPDVISPPQGGSTAKGRAPLAPAAPRALVIGAEPWRGGRGVPGVPAARRGDGRPDAQSHPRPGQGDGVPRGSPGVSFPRRPRGLGRGSSPVQWRREGAAALPEGSAVHQGALVLPHASLAAAGTYSCHGEDGSLLHTVSLRLGHLPGVPFVSCRASDYENFSCSWTSSLETFLPTRYITTYRKKSLTGEEKRRNKSGHVGPCLQDPSRAGTCTVHRSEFWSSYRLNITEVNPLGSSFRLLDITMQAIIKPDPPEGLVVEPVPLAPRRLYVSWKYPASWPKEPHFQLRFRLQYRPVIHRSWSVVETVNLSEVITDAFAGLEHVVQVSAKDFLDAGNWSEWSAEARATPVRDPATTASEGTTTDASLESLAEEPSQAPNPEPINRSDPLEKMAILVSLGIFAFFILAAVLVITILIWLRVRKHSKDETKPHNFLVAATHLKALPRTQILP